MLLTDTYKLVYSLSQFVNHHLLQKCLILSPPPPAGNDPPHVRLRPRRRGHGPDASRSRSRHQQRGRCQPSARQIRRRVSATPIVCPSFNVSHDEPLPLTPPPPHPHPPDFCLLCLTCSQHALCFPQQPVP